jgi:hypothetical protein
VTSGQAALAPAARTNWKPFAAAAVLLVLVGGGAAGFYAYRRQRAQPTTTLPVETQSQTQPPTQSQSSQPSEPANNSAGQPNESKEAVESKSSQAKADKSKAEAPKTEPPRNAQTNPETKAAQDPFKNFPSPEVFDPAHAGDPNRGRDRSPQPGQPPFDPMRPLPGEERGPRRPEVRVMPNGGRIIKNPDGSIIMIGPNGKTTTIPPPLGRDRRKPNGNENRP